MPSGEYLFDDVLQDVRYAFSASRSSPVLAAARILSLALGIGAKYDDLQSDQGFIPKTLPVSHPGRK